MSPPAKPKTKAPPKPRKKREPTKSWVVIRRDNGKIVDTTHYSCAECHLASWLRQHYLGNRYHSQEYKMTLDIFDAKMQLVKKATLIHEVRFEDTKTGSR